MRDEFGRLPSEDKVARRLLSPATNGFLRRGAVKDAIELCGAEALSVITKMVGDFYAGRKKWAAPRAVAPAGSAHKNRQRRASGFFCAVPSCLFSCLRETDGDGLLMALDLSALRAVLGFSVLITVHFVFDITPGASRISPFLGHVIAEVLGHPEEL